MYQSNAAPWLWFRAWATDGSAKTDLVYNTSGISIKVARDNQADSSALSLSAASGPTDWAAGKLHQVVGNLYKVGIATASISAYTGNITVSGSYTGGTIEGVIDQVSAYNPAYEPLRPTTAGHTLNVSDVGAGDAVLNSEYLFDDGFGRKAVNANVTHYQGTLQGNGDLPAKLDAIKDVTNKIDTGLVLDGVVWQFTVNMLEAAIAEVPKYGDIQRHAQEDYDVTSKTVDVTVTKVT